MEENKSSVRIKRGRDSSCLLDFVMDNVLVLLTVVGVILGIALGVVVRGADPSQDVVIWIGLPGQVYMRMLKMMILPLIICSIISGTASLDPKCNGRVSIIAFIYIFVSNSLACIVPMFIALLIKPGVGVDFESASIEKKEAKVLETVDIFVDLIRNLFPDNVVTACFSKAQTTYDIESVTYTHNISTGEGLNATWELQNLTVHNTIKGVGSVPSTNVLGLVLCCLIFGMATASLGPVGQPFQTFFFSANEVIVRVLKWFVWMTPLGVASLISVAFLQTSNLDSAVKSLGMLSFCVLSGLAIHNLILVPAVHYVILRENPYTFLISLGRPWMVSFAAASCAVAIPETLTALETHQKIDTRITRFVVPFATTINRDGSCVFITVACVFVSQLTGTELHVGRIILIWVLTTVVSIAIPAVPSSGVVVVIINLTAMGVPVELVGLLFASEWILDRFRTASNMLSHAHCVMVVYKFCKDYLPSRVTVQDIKLELEGEVDKPMLKPRKSEINYN